MRGDREKCLSAGMDDYISKPIDLESLAALLKKWLVDMGQSEAEPPAVTPPPQTTSAPSKIFDSKAYLACVANDRDLAVSIMESFYKDVDVRIQKAIACLEKNDVAGAQLEAHSIKGAAATVCADALSKEAAVMEKQLKNGETAAATAQIENIQKRYKEFLSEMSAHPL
jgi:HPt (histidine-containing phosphotransfer) domain-containing protein